MRTPKRWSYDCGMLPHRVTAYEAVDRGNVVHLRWKTGPNKWSRKSLGFTVRTGGRLDQEAVRRAEKAAELQYHRLIGVAQQEERAMTLAEGLALITDAERGRYRTKTPHRAELERCLTVAMEVLGKDRPFSAVERGDIRMLWRRELKRQAAHGRSGHRATELVISRLFLVAAWLRDEEKIPASACLPWSKWKEEFRADCGAVTIHRPRHSLAEYRKLLETAPSIDPRFALLFSWGAELRLGQVRRISRSDVQLDAIDGAPHGLFQVRGAGKKRGTWTVMTKGQRAALDVAIGEGGYLHTLEQLYRAKEIADYPMFPGGQLTGSRKGPLRAERKHVTRAPMDRTMVRALFNACETAAGIPHVKGRGWYGSRRGGVDGAKAGKISREGLQQWGGWADTQVPDKIYADQKASYAMTEAAEVRATVRGES